MRRYRSATRDRFSAVGLFRNRTISEPVGSGLILRLHSGVPLSFSTTLPCRHWGATVAARCFFWGLARAWVQPMLAGGVLEPMELGHLPYKDATFEHYVGVRGFEQFGKDKWCEYVNDIVARLIAALEPDDVVLGGGNINNLRSLPAGAVPATTRTHSSAASVSGTAW